MGEVISGTWSRDPCGLGRFHKMSAGSKGGPWGLRLQKLLSGLIQLRSAPNRPPSELSSVLSRCEMSTGSATEPSAHPQSRLLSFRPFHRGGLHLPKGPAVKVLSPKRASLNPRPKSRAPVCQKSLSCRLTSGPGRPEAWRFRPSALPSRSGPGATPESVGSRVSPPLRSSPGKSGWKSHSQKVPKLQRSEVRSQAAAAAETSPSNPRRSEPQGRQPRVSAAIQERNKLDLGRPTAT